MHNIGFFVINGKGPCILGLQSIILFNLINTVNKTAYSDRPNTSEHVLKQSSDVFGGIGYMKGEYNIVLEEKCFS